MVRRGSTVNPRVRSANLRRGTWGNMRNSVAQMAISLRFLRQKKVQVRYLSIHMVKKI
jgi:hypothetical protein